MSYLASLSNVWLSVNEGIARVLGLQFKVELSDHSIDVEFAKPDKDESAWDTNMYRNGNVFVAGYANPIKPVVNEHAKFSEPNTVDVDEGGEPENESDDIHVSMISSSRYRDYMRQDLVSQLLTPQEQWKLIAYAVLGVIILQFVGMIITLYATGSF